MDTLEEAPDVFILRTSYDHGIGEVYSPPRVVPISVKHGFNGGWSLDKLVKDSDGHAWNFDDPEMRDRARALVSKGFALLVIGSPMCTYFSNIMNIAKLRMKPGDFERKYVNACLICNSCSSSLTYNFRMTDMYCSSIPPVRRRGLYHSLLK